MDVAANGAGQPNLAGGQNSPVSLKNARRCPPRTATGGRLASKRNAAAAVFFGYSGRSSASPEDL
jgi:hypothetical protein